MSKTILAAALALAVLAGCGGGAEQPPAGTTTGGSGGSGSAAATAPAAKLPADLKLAEAPKGALGVVEMKDKAKDGAEIVVHGRIGGYPGR